MVGQLVRKWWIPVVRGALGILVGILVFAYARTAVEVFVYLFGAYALVDGIFALALAVDDTRGRSSVVLSGIASIAMSRAGARPLLKPSTCDR